MDTDLFLTVGVVLMVVSIPSLLSAYVEGRAPRVAMIIVAASAVVVAMAVRAKPGGYAMADLPQVFFGVIARLF